MALNHHQGKNAPYLSKLYIIKKGSVTFPTELQYLQSLQYSDDLTLVGSFEQIDFLPNSATWQQTKPQESGVDTYTIQIQAKVNKASRTNAEWLRQYEGHQIIALALDRNTGSEHMMAGSDEAFATLTWSEDVSNTNLLTITITATQGHPAYYYTGAFTPA